MCVCIVCMCSFQVGKIIARALKSLQGHGVVISREAWLKEAEAAETGTSCVHTDLQVSEAALLQRCLRLSLRMRRVAGSKLCNPIIALYYKAAAVTAAYDNATSQ